MNDGSMAGLRSAVPEQDVDLRLEETLEAAALGDRASFFRYRADGASAKGAAR
jgi:hypothetical protein